MSYEDMINILQEILDKTEWIRLDRMTNLERVIIELLKRKIQEEELLWNEGEEPEGHMTEDRIFKTCVNCAYFKDRRCTKKAHNYGAFRQEYWSCGMWEANDIVRRTESRKKMVDEMVNTWLKEDTPEWIREKMREALAKQSYAGWPEEEGNK